MNYLPRYLTNSEQILELKIVNHNEEIVNLFDARFANNGRLLLNFAHSQLV